MSSRIRPTFKTLQIAVITARPSFTRNSTGLSNGSAWRWWPMAEPRRSGRLSPRHAGRRRAPRGQPVGRVRAEQGRRAAIGTRVGLADLGQAGDAVLEQPRRLWRGRHARAIGDDRRRRAIPSPSAACGRCASVIMPATWPRRGARTMQCRGVRTRTASRRRPLSSRRSVSST